MRLLEKPLSGCDQGSSTAQSLQLTRRLPGLCATSQPLGGGGLVAFLAALYFSHDIGTMRKDREMKRCTNNPEQVTVVVSKFAIDVI